MLIQSFIYFLVVAIIYFHVQISIERFKEIIQSIQKIISSTYYINIYWNYCPRASNEIDFFFINKYSTAMVKLYKHLMFSIKNRVCYRK